MKVEKKKKTQILLLEMTLFLTKQLKFQENIWTLIDRKASVELKSRPHSQIFGPAGQKSEIWFHLQSVEKPPKSTGPEKPTPKGKSKERLA